MEDNTWQIIGAVWLAIWIMRLVTTVITAGWSYYVNDGIVELVVLILMVVLGIVALCYPYLRKKAPSIMYKVSKNGRCPDCYAKTYGNTFCPKCGKDLTERITARTCWNCGYVEEDTTVNSCPKCGREFKKE